MALLGDHEIRERNVATVRQFFRAERELDMDGWSELWADDAVRRTPFAPDGLPKEVRGKPEIMRVIRGPFEQAARIEVQDEVFPLQDPTTVVARAHIRGEGKAGDVYENELVAFFRFDDQGKIVEWTGFLNPLPILKLLGRSIAEPTPPSST